MFRYIFIEEKEFDQLLEKVFKKIRDEKNPENLPKQNQDFTLECAEYVQSLIMKELTLINSRMSWLLISETFLIAAYATLINDFEPQYYTVINVFLVMLPVGGSLLSLLSLMAILSADAVATYLGCREGHIMKSVNRIYKKKISRVSSYKFRQKKIRWTLWVGSIPNFMIPLSISLFWFILSCWIPVCRKKPTDNRQNLEDQFLCFHDQWDDNFSPLKVAAIVVCVIILIASLVFSLWYRHESYKIRKKFEENNIV
ncbi:MAG: hypothetical protein QNJ33_17415 [Crocosphaera sp.]|nr:hypothetical protein [Crocosphaera sp.]